MGDYDGPFRLCYQVYEGLDVMGSDIFHSAWSNYVVQKYKIILHFINEIPNFVRPLEKRK
jgi:hypothetical protein